MKCIRLDIFWIYWVTKSSSWKSLPAVSDSYEYRCRTSLPASRIHLWNYLWSPHVQLWCCFWCMAARPGPWK